MHLQLVSACFQHFLHRSLIVGTYYTLLLPNGRVVTLLTAEHSKGYTNKTMHCPHDSNSTPDSADPIWFLSVYTAVTNHPM